MISFVQVKVSLDFLSKSEYGIWLTIASILGWISIFDLGFGDGLRNKLAGSIAQNNIKRAKIYISTAYVSISIIFLSVILLITPLLCFIDVSKLLRLGTSISDEVNLAIIVAFIGTCLTFVLRLLNVVFWADQKAMLPNLLGAIVQAGILVAIMICGKYLRGSILLFSALFTLIPVIVYSLATWISFRGNYRAKSILLFSALFTLIPVIVYSLATWISFRGNYRAIAPSIKFARRSFVRDIVNIGSRFFIIQLSALILYSTDNVLLNYYFGSGNVTIYNIAFRYFNILIFGFGIILLPYWSMATHAMKQNDTTWIKKAAGKLIFFWTIFLAIGLLMCTVANWSYRVWLGPGIHVPYSWSIVLFVFAMATNWAGIFNTLLYGIGEINLIVYLSIAGVLLNIPMCIAMIKWTNLGQLSIPYAYIIYTVVAGVLVTIQFMRLFKGMPTRLNMV